MESSAFSNPALAGHVSAEQGDDRALIRAAQRGSQAAGEALARRHWPTAFKAAFLILGSKEDAEDVAQESLLAALSGIRGFHRNRRFDPWLKRIVANRAIDLARAKQRERRLEEDLRAEAFKTAASKDQSRLSDPELAAAILSLPLEQREVVVLRHVLGFSTGEIVRALKIPRGTVGSRLRRGLDQLSATYGRPA